MSPPPSRCIPRAAIAWPLLALIVASGAPAWSAAAPAPAAAAPQEARPSIQPAPARSVRIGLTADRVKVRVSADGGIIVRDPVKKAPIWKQRFDAGIWLVADITGATGPGGPLFRVQVASFADKTQAEAKQKDLQALLPAEKIVLHYNPDRRSWRVRVGEFLAREDAAPLIERLNAEGYTETWITEESRDGGGRRRIRLVDDRWHDFLTSHDRVLIVPARPGAVVRMDQSSYRGSLEARVTRSGNLQVINEVDLEEYLRGVVPNEMGPGVYPELQALKAQAVAARTYIIANLGQFAEDGFDVCDTPGCQVYRGSGTEHPLTDQAVAETRDQILTWEGQPIDALYTSTCGGHTEDGVAVFADKTGPYLKGVPCYPEAEAENRTVSGRTWIDPVVLEDGAPANEEISILQKIGVVDSGALDRGWLLARATPAETERWTAGVLKIIGKTPARSAWDDGGVDLAGMARYLARSLGWDERLQMALDDRDLPYLLAFRDRDEIGADTRRPYAVLILEGILQPFRDNTVRPRHQPSRGLVLRTLHRILDYYGSTGVGRASYRGSDGERLLFEVAGAVQVFNLAPDAALFRTFRDVAYPATRLPLVLGDRLQYRQAGDGRIDYLKVTANQRGVADDRYSSTFRWEQRYTRSELEEVLARRINVGTLKDVEPVKRGVSGRVTEVRIAGSRGVFTVKGFPIRSALGVKENLFTVDRTYGTDGRVASFIFTGKGWGHGVGLCQVGAYGMALRGKDYEEILRHYYRGAAIGRHAGAR
jgi:stage II sporulation protein D